MDNTVCMRPQVRRRGGRASTPATAWVGNRFYRRDVLPGMTTTTTGRPFADEDSLDRRT